MSAVKFLVCLLLLYYFSIVRSDCILKYPDNIENVPRYEKYIGKYKIQIPYNGNSIILQEGEILNGYCDTHFSPISYNTDSWVPYRQTHHVNVVKYVNNLTSITTTCRNRKLLYKMDSYEEIEITELKCVKMNWGIYATDDKYSWCEKNQNSNTFLFATKSNWDHHILAGICYNLDQLALETITYNVTYLQSRDMELLMGISKTNLKSYHSLTDDLWNLKTTKTLEISQEQLQQQISNLSTKNAWLNLANYEVSSIVQGDTYGRYFKEYNNILNIIWWRNLRLGNWKGFMNTLENYAYNNSFQLYTGTSDEVIYPNKQNQNTILEIKNGFKNETIPAYIWTYLKSTDNRNRDFIVVGYNSPYAEFFSLNNIIFCPDICSEIPWLTEIHSSFRFATAGIMFCCSTDFIRQTNRLHGFPLDILLKDQLANKTEIEVATQTEITTKISETTETDMNTESFFYLNTIDDHTNKDNAGF